MKSDDISRRCYELSALLRSCRALASVMCHQSALEAEDMQRAGDMELTLEVAERLLDEIHGPFDMGHDFEVPPVQKEAAQ